MLFEFPDKKIRFAKKIRHDLIMPIKAHCGKEVVGGKDDPIVLEMNNAGGKPQCRLSRGLRKGRVGVDGEGDVIGGGAELHC